MIPSSYYTCGVLYWHFLMVLNGNRVTASHLNTPTLYSVDLFSFRNNWISSLLFLFSFLFSFFFLSSEAFKKLIKWRISSFLPVSRYCFIILYILLLESLSHHLTLVVFHFSLSDNKSTPISKALLSILADLNHAVVWVVSILPLISNSSSFLSKYLGTVPSAPTTIGITDTLMFSSFFIVLRQGLDICSCFFVFLLLFSGPQEQQNLQDCNFSFFFSFFFS